MALIQLIPLNSTSVGEHWISILVTLSVNSDPAANWDPELRMIQPSDRIPAMNPAGPTHSAPDVPMFNHFQAVGPAPRVLQLNVEGLPAAERTPSSSIVQSYNEDASIYRRPM